MKGGVGLCVCGWLVACWLVGWLAPCSIAPLRKSVSLTITAPCRTTILIPLWVIGMLASATLIVIPLIFTYQVRAPGGTAMRELFTMPYSVLPLAGALLVLGAVACGLAIARKLDNVYDATWYGPQLAGRGEEWIDPCSELC